MNAGPRTSASHRASRGYELHKDEEGASDEECALEGFNVLDGRERSFTESYDADEGDEEDYQQAGSEELWQCARCKSYSPGNFAHCTQCYESRPEEDGMEDLDDKDPLRSHYPYDDEYDEDHIIPPDAPRYGYDDDDDEDAYDTFPAERDNSGTESFHEKFDMFVVMNDIPFNGLPGEGDTPNQDVEDQYRHHSAQQKALFQEYHVGDQVEVHYDKEGVYYPATIVSIGHKGFDYGVTYHDINNVVLGTNAPTLRKLQQEGHEASTRKRAPPPKKCSCWCFSATPSDEEAPVREPQNIAAGSGTFT